MIGQAELRIRLTTIVIAVAIAFASRTGQSEHPSGSSAEASGKRVTWTTSRIVGTPEPPLPYVAQRVFPKLQFERPTTIISVPGTDRMIVTQLERNVVSFQRNAAVESFETAIDMSQVHPEFFQTFGIAFHPQYPRVPWCYICRVERGGNYGWSIIEDSQSVHRTATRGPTPISPPIVEHSHVEARSVTGGYFYYGDRLPQLDGCDVRQRLSPQVLSRPGTASARSQVGGRRALDEDEQPVASSKVVQKTPKKKTDRGR